MATSSSQSSSTSNNINASVSVSINLNNASGSTSQQHQNNLLHYPASSSRPNRGYNHGSSGWSGNLNGGAGRNRHRQHNVRPLHHQQFNNNALPHRGFFGPQQHPPLVPYSNTTYIDPYNNIPPPHIIAPYFMPSDYFPPPYQYGDYPYYTYPSSSSSYVPHPYYTEPSSSSYVPQSPSPTGANVDMRQHGEVPKADLCEPIRKQIEYYFSFENLVKDEFLRRRMDASGWVSIDLIANFNKVKGMTRDIDMIHKALTPSQVVQVQGNKIRLRRNWKPWILPSNTSQKHSRDAEGLLEGIRDIQLHVGSEVEKQTTEGS